MLTSELVRFKLFESEIRFTPELTRVVDKYLQFTISSTVNYTITLIVPFSFFMINKRNRRIVWEDLKRLWKFITCHNTDTITLVSGSTWFILFVFFCTISIEFYFVIYNILNKGVHELACDEIDGLWELMWDDFIYEYV